MRKTSGICNSTWRSLKAKNSRAGGCYYRNTSRSRIICTVCENGVRYLLERIVRLYKLKAEETVIVWRHGKDDRVTLCGKFYNEQTALTHVVNVELPIDRKITAWSPEADRLHIS